MERFYVLYEEKYFLIIYCDIGLIVAELIMWNYLIIAIKIIIRKQNIN